MKRVLAVILGLSLLLWCSCTSLSDNGSVPGNYSEMPVSTEEMPENSIESTYYKYPVKLIKIGGEIYYDTGEMSEMLPRCGTLDGLIEKVYDEYFVPENDGEANFAPMSEYYGTGWQKISNNTIEVPTEDGWVIFRKAESEIKAKPQHYRYCMRLGGSKKKNGEILEYLVFTDNMGMTFADIAAANTENAILIPAKYGKAYDWGITMSVKDVSSAGLTIVISQSGGNIKGELQTGSPFFVDMWNGKFWESYDTVSGVPLAWTMLAYPLMKNSNREFRCDWSYVYGELPVGKYRISKEISDFYHSVTGFDTHRFYVEFEIKE